jgi:glutaconate CoA-transferase, subunit A
MDKRMSVDGVVAELRDGMTVGIGGWGARRKPMELVRAICRSPLRDLTVVSYGGPDVGMLCSAGKVRRVVFGFVSLDRVAVDPHFRRARQAGEIEVTELDEGMLQWGLHAAGLRLPFLPTRAGLASDVERNNPELRRVVSPYDGDELIAMPAIRLDAALVHVNRADARGTGQILGVDPYFDDLFCMAAERAYISCEQVVPTDRLLDRGCVHDLRINRMYVHGVVEALRGAWFTSCAPDYAVDEAALDDYVAAADPARWPAWLESAAARPAPSTSTS